MPSTPLTLIEGAYALPRPHPLDDLPVPLRHEWALLASGPGQRNERRSLYAALLCTVCLSNRQLLSRRRWKALDSSPLDGRPATVASSATAKPGVTRRAIPGDGLRDLPLTPAQAPKRVALKLRRPARAKRRAAGDWHRIAAGVCIVGALALLAWLAMDRHRALRQLASEASSPVAIATGKRDGQQGTQPSHVEVAGRQAIVVHESHAQAARVAPTYADVASPPASASASASIRNTVSRRAARGDTPAHPPQRAQVAGIQRRPARPSQRALVPHASAIRATQNASRALAARSATSADASFAQTWPAGSGYTAITTSATTHPRAATSNNRPANNSTAWMNHMTQRRVTEVPEQFGQ